MTITTVAQHIDLDLRKAVVGLASLFIFFVLPISIFGQNSSQSTDQGQVAGVETTSTEVVPEAEITTTSEEPVQTTEPLSADILFLIIGVIFLGVCLILIAFFLADSVRSKRK